MKYFLLLFLLQGCVTALSTGANLPQAPADTKDVYLKILVSHNCSSGWCSGFDVNVQNLSDEVVEILPPKSSLSRANQVAKIATSDTDKLKIPAKADVNISFFPYDKALNNQPIEYPNPQSVWCSMAETSCPNKSEGAAICASAARSYFEAYANSQGWIVVNLAYKVNNTVSVITTESPQSIGTKPPSNLSANSFAPNWTFGGDDSVFYKVQCNDKCKCELDAKRRNFFKDDIFRLKQ